MAKEPKAKEHSKKSKAKEYTKTCLEDSTERSESNPGRSLGIKAMTRNGCLEDSTKQIKTEQIKYQ